MNERFLQVRERIVFTLAIALTIAWVAIAGLYLHRLGLGEIFGLPPSQLALVLTGVFGPLVALWLIVAVMEQRREVAHVSRRLGEMLTLSRQSVQQVEAQTRVLMQLQAQAARAQSAEARTLALHDLAANAAVLAERLGVVGRDAQAAAWARYGAGDKTVFVQAFLGFAATHPDIAARMAEAVARDAVARTALAAFVRHYEQLTVSSVDEKMVRDILEDGALGRGYRLFKEADALAAAQHAPAHRAAAHDAADADAAHLAALSERLEAAAPPEMEASVE